MTVHTLFPSYVDIFYQHSGFGAHIMRRPTRLWTGTPWTTAGEYTAWDESIVAADVMIEAFIDLALPLFKPAVSFTSYIIYTVPGSGEDGVPVFAKNLTGKVGTSASTSQDVTFTKTFTYLSAANHAARVALMDVPTGGEISRRTSLSAGDELDFALALVDPQWAWAARDDEQPVVWRAVINDVNKALKKRYRIAAG